MLMRPFALIVGSIHAPLSNECFARQTQQTISEDHKDIERIDAVASTAASALRRQLPARCDLWRQELAVIQLEGSLPLTCCSVSGRQWWRRQPLASISINYMLSIAVVAQTTLFHSVLSPFCPEQRVW